ncbi:MAG: hypothetical protein Q7R96_05945 [Nanoarchaeota archaeon]|nr:hypothetical protein [Nanoarchaeota archaeon]
MAEDIHKKLAVVILLVVIVISALGTWTILEATGRTQRPVINENPVTTGRVSVMILPPEEQPSITGDEAS